MKRSSSSERTSLGAGGSPGGSGTASPSSATPSSCSAGSCSSAMSCRPSRARSQPHSNHACAAVPCTRTVRTSAIAGQSVARCERQRDVRAHAMSEAAQRGKSSASRAYGPGTSSHSIELTISRSVTPTSWSSSCAPHGGSPRQRRNTGRSEMRSGSTMLAGAAARDPRSVSSTTSVTRPRSVSGTSHRSTSARASMRLSSA